MYRSTRGTGTINMVPEVQAVHTVLYDPSPY